ncbi:MAG: zonular occludens toxin domain-containing protein [Lachnospiraceae bacterium]|nr:zonular occludens toxin domain-containing protein [Lachnospiraceae bacterium]
MANIMSGFLSFFIAVFKIPLILAGGFFGFFIGSIFFWYMVEYLKGNRVRRGSVRRLKKRGFFVRLFWDAPRRYVKDLYEQKPDFFKPQGLIIFTGRQGNGKTSALMQYAIDMLDRYPKAKCLSNTAFAYQDKKLSHWRQLIDYKIEHKGVIVIMDELQNWFGSNQSRNVPPEMLSVITQNRKNRRVILGTAQNFYLLAKAIRSQCTEIRQCVTFCGVLTVVIRREPVCDEAGDVNEMKFRGMYFFVHSERLRNSYDTWSTVAALSDSGFKEEQAVPEPQVRVVVGCKK